LIGLDIRRRLDLRKDRLRQVAPIWVFHHPIGMV
jgi:hypothetical protein